MSVNQVFLHGNAAHNKAVSMLTNLGKLIKLSAPSFDIDSSLEMFDLVMQGFMLKIAIADGDFAKEEIAYIQAICDKADILERLNKASKGTLDVSWIGLKFMNAEHREKIVSILERIVTELTEKFFVPYAAVDTVLDKNIYEDIKESILTILAAFAMIDGDSDNFSEHIAIVQILKVLETAWNKANDRINGYDHSDKGQVERPVPARNSLKARYEMLKKN